MKTIILSTIECCVISKLMKQPEGLSPSDLAKITGVARPTVYVLLRRLAARKFVSSRQLAGATVIYKTTQAGVKARTKFAEFVGLKA